VNARVLVPWKSVSDALGDLGDLTDGNLTVEVFTGHALAPDDLGDVVFFTVPYDRPYSTEPIPRLSGSGLSRRSRPDMNIWSLFSPPG
jgi:hypothetical protein